MPNDTLVLRKDAHWFIVGAPVDRDERRALVLSLLQYAENRSFEVELSAVDDLAKELGWTLAHKRGFISAA